MRTETEISSDVGGWEQQTEGAGALRDQGKRQDEAPLGQAESNGEILFVGNGIVLKSPGISHET